MTYTDFLIPVFVEVLLIFILLGWMGLERSRGLASGQVKSEDIALDGRNYTPRARQIGNCFTNQFELPTLFFVLIVFILITRLGDLLLLVLAWVFVVSRIAHAYVHTTSNDVDWRFRAYAVGVITLLVMWLVFAAKVLTGT